MISRFIPKNRTGVPQFSPKMGRLKKDITKMSYDTNTPNGEVEERRNPHPKLGNIFKKGQNQWCGNSQILGGEAILKISGVAEWLRCNVSYLVGSHPVVGTTNHKPTANSAVHPFEVCE